MHRGTLTGDALAATVLDLAARDYLELEQIAPGDFLCRLPRSAPPGDVTPYEQRVLDLLQRRAVHRTVPTEALTLGVDDEHAEWWASFKREVTEDASARGLGHSWSYRTAALFAVALCGVLAIAFGIASTQPGSRWAGIPSIVFFAIAFFSTYFWGEFPTRLALTSNGRAAAARWATVRHEFGAAHGFYDVPPTGVVVWDRNLAVAAAVGIAPVACRGLPIGPDRRHEVWVRRGAIWKQVPVRYPRRVPPGWGRAPGLAILIATVGIAISGTVVVFAARPGAWDPHPPFSSGFATVLGDLEPVIAGVAAAVLLLSIWQLVLAVPDAFTKTTPVEGIVVARWVRRGRRINPWGDWIPRYRYLAVDDGSATRIRGWRVSQRDFESVLRGDLVVADIEHHLGYVRNLRAVDP